MFDVGRDHGACPFVAHGGGEDVDGELGELGPDILKNIGVLSLPFFRALRIIRIFSMEEYLRRMHDCFIPKISST